MHATTWMNLESIMPCEISHKWANIVILLYEVTRIGRLIETENRIEVSMGRREKGEGSYC